MTPTAGTVIVLVGPTASGKTAVALALAPLLNAEILSADSRQIYRLLDIGTAKPTPAERAQVPHHFVDMLPPDQPSSAGQFGEQARACAMEVLGRGHVPLVVGGSGLYLRAMIDGLFEGPGADPEIRERLERQWKDRGVASLIEDLRKVDPASAAAIDPTKPRRLVRALEVFLLTGRPLSDLHREAKPAIPFVVRQFGLRWDRAALYRRIEARCDAMLQEGLVEETRSLAAAGYDRSLVALNTVGYAEAFAMLAGEMGEEEMARRFKQETRRYAKRQMTWFRADERITWIDLAEPLDARAAAERIAGLIHGGA